MADTSNLDFIYQPIKEKMQETITHITFLTYIDKLVPVEIDGRYIVLETLTENFAQYITNNLAEKMRDAIIKANVGVSDFRLVVKGSRNYAYETSHEEPAYTPPNLNKRFTFDSFVAGNNLFAYEAAKNVADDPAGVYNPLFIYGGTGLGKTHLIQAIANQILAEKPNLKVVYATCEQFVNEIIDTMFASKGPDARERSNRLRQHYRNADVLIIDDIQFIANKKAVQEEFFHTFNELHNKGKQIVITSDRPPKEITTLENRIRTRFESGIIADISAPEYETRIAIIKRKAKMMNFVIPDDVVECIANHLKSSIRQLEGCVKKLKASQDLVGTAPTIVMAQNAIREILSDEQPEPITVERIISNVASVYGVSSDDIRSNKRSSQISTARKVCAYVIKQVLQIPYKAIGTEIGGKDHSTVIYYLDDVEKKMNEDPHQKEIIEDIIRNVRSE